MGGLSNGYVENLMKCISPIPEKFKSVWPCDLFLEEMKKNKEELKRGDCYIINLSASHHKGSHFVAVFLTSKKSAEYFDSYALPSSIDQNLREAFKVASLEIREFRKPIQAQSSQFCGLFCSEYFFEIIIHYISFKLHFFT